MSIEAMKLALEALGQEADEYAIQYEGSIPDHIAYAITSLSQAIEQAEKQVVFKIYKPTLPRGAIPNVRDAELPWVYDQDPSSGNVASMWVTPVKATLQPQQAESITQITQDHYSNQNEPVAWVNWCAATGKRSVSFKCESELASQPLYTTPQPQQDAWKNAAILLGEELSSFGPDGYYDMTAEQWLSWALDQQPNGKHSLPQLQREWVGLTNADWNSIAYTREFRAGAEWGERLMREKNGNNT